MICISIVSHGHAELLPGLIHSLKKNDLISQIILTINVPEVLPNISDPKLTIIKNDFPRGFGENHNNAFLNCNQDFFCVLNPDITIIGDLFPNLIEMFNIKNVAVVAPKVIDEYGIRQDNMRDYLYFYNIVTHLLLYRILRLKYNKYSSTNIVYPEWVAGMFMLFKSGIYKLVGGFDNNYYMYCEDMDICRRISKNKYKIIGSNTVFVVHSARRASRRNIQHFFWHLKSLITFLFKK